MYRHDNSSIIKNLLGMSQTLIQSDNLTLTGYSYKTEEKDDAIHINFTLHINGKLKSFWYSFLVKEEDSNYGWTMVDWNGWNALYYVLTNIGYQPSFSPDDGFGHWQAQRFIEMIMNSGK